VWVEASVLEILKTAKNQWEALKAFIAELINRSANNFNRPKIPQCNHQKNQDRISRSNSKIISNHQKIKFIEQYQSEIEKLRLGNKKFTNIITPIDIVNTPLNTMSRVPEYDAIIASLKAEIASEVGKSET
jgi:hypothetical protein